MALIPTDENHRLQILAGTLGRLRGHDFEKFLTDEINKKDWAGFKSFDLGDIHLFIGKPVEYLLSYVITRLNLTNQEVHKIESWWLGGLATLNQGDIVESEGIVVAKSKSDILIRITTDSAELTVGISVKSCNKKTPTNDQLYFTTATGFSNLLRANQIDVSDDFEKGMKMFCGDKGYRPLDLLSKDALTSRISDPSRYFFEEIPTKNRTAIVEVFTKLQEQITRVLLQKAYPNDPYEPQFVIHQTHLYEDMNDIEVALFTLDELIAYSQKASPFVLKEYVIRKGTYKHDDAVHQAPRFGFIQFQRGGQKQHPTQLQFNLQAGYFNKI